MKTTTPSTREEKRAAIRKRIGEHVAAFKVGDEINALLDGVEIEGKIASIDGNRAKIELPYGNFTVNLVFANLV